MTKYEIEIQKAQNEASSNEISAFKSGIRQIGLNNLEAGDIVTIPAGYKVFEQTIAGSDATAQYLIANVKRGEEETALRFYPSSFTKMGVNCTPVGDGTYTRGSFVHATGDVVDHVQNFGDMNDAVKSLVGKPFSVKFTPVNFLSYESRQKTEDINDNDINKTRLPEYSFV